MDATSADSAEKTESRASSVATAYEQIQDMVISFALLPGERINESELSRKLGVSRTPLREALNRLASESFVEYVPSKGFFCRKIKPAEIFDLMQLRIVIETAAARLAVAAITDAQIAALDELLSGLADTAGKAPSAVVAIDERFHETLTGYSGNKELSRVLHSVNVRIRPMRFLAANSDAPQYGYRQHQMVLDALKARDADRLVQVLTEHIERPLDVIESEVKDLYGRIYVS